MIRFVAVAVACCALWLSAAAASQAAAPEQFRVWGKQAKAHPYLAAPEPAKSVPAQPAVTAEETARGFRVFAKPPAFLFRPDTDLAVGDRCESLSARDCAGQYGPITFAVEALRAGEFSAAVTDLAGPGGKTIAAENFDVRFARIVKVTAQKKTDVAPMLLESAEKKAVADGSMQQVWITYYVPPATVPGTYEGKVRVLVGGAEKLAIPLRLTVYPFALAEPDVNLYMYFSNSTEPSDLALTEKQLADQRCHGMNVAPLVMPVTSDGDLKPEVLAALLDAYKRVGFTRPHLIVELWNRITAEWLNTPDKSVQMWGPWFRYYPFSERLDRRYVETVRRICQEARARGYGVALQVADEPGSHAWTTEATQHYSDLIRREVPDVLRELTVGGGWAMGRPEDELWRGRINIWTTNRWLPDKLDLVRRIDPKAAIQVYNMAGGGSQPGGVDSARMLYGFFNWKAKAAGASQWVYYHSSTPEDNYAWPAEGAAEGYVPTIRWEMVREGAKDRRYLATLEGRLAGKSGPAADEARRFLEEISARIILRTDQYDPIGGGRIPAPPPGTLDQWRDRIAELIQKL